MRWSIFLLVFIVLGTSVFARELTDFSNVKFGKNRDRSQASIAQQGISGPIQCGVKLNLPAGWRVERNEENSVLYAGPQGMFLQIVMSPISPDFPVAASLQAYLDRGQKEKQEGKLISAGERIIDGVRGSQRVEAVQPQPDDPRRITWIGYRGTMVINIVANSKSRDFDQCYSTLDQLVGKIKW